MLDALPGAGIRGHRHAPRGWRLVHGRSRRPAHRQAGRGAGHARGRRREHGHRPAHGAPELHARRGSGRPGASATSWVARRSRRSTSSSRFGRLTKWAAQIDDPATAAETVSAGPADGPVRAARARSSSRFPRRCSTCPRHAAHWAQSARSPSRASCARSGGRARDPQATATRQAAGDHRRLRRDPRRRARRAGELAERLAVPVFTSWRRPTAFPNDHPNYLGMSGYGSPDSVQKRLATADFLLVIGSRLSEVSTFDYKLPARRTRWAHVDLEPRDCPRRTHGARHRRRRPTPPRS